VSRLVLSSFVSRGHCFAAPLRCFRDLRHEDTKLMHSRNQDQQEYRDRWSAEGFLLFVRRLAARELLQWGQGFWIESLGYLEPRTLVLSTSSIPILGEPVSINASKRVQFPGAISSDLGVKKVGCDQIDILLESVRTGPCLRFDGVPSTARNL
jgi:hypothetical protein